MELKINELEDDTFYDDYDNEPIDYSFEQIPENTVPTKVIKNVHFDQTSVKPMHQPIPKSNAKVVRPQVPPKKPQISYEDIMAKMGMLVSNGKLHLVDRDSIPPHLQQHVSRQMNNPQKEQNQYQQHQYQQKQYQQNQYQQQKQQHQYQEQNQGQQNQVPQNSYIYNKYFKDELNEPEQVRRPRTLQEYKMMLLQDYLQRQRIKQIKSTKLIMPTTNISMASNNGNLNKLFNFSKR